jgi:hypothetical protein
VVGDAAHGRAAALRERDAEDRGRGARVIEKHLVEIPESEQQDHALGQLRLDAAVLPHHRGQLFTSHVEKLLNPGSPGQLVRSFARSRRTRQYGIRG